MWRESLGQAFKLPGGQIDFVCPNNIPWDATGEQLPEPARQPKREPDPIYEANKATCEACGMQDDCKVWHAPTCTRNKAWMGLIPNVCMEGLLKTILVE